MPELQIEKSESEQLALAISNVARHYDLGATQKTLDWTNLISTLAMVYGTRVYAMNVRRKTEAAAREASRAPGAGMIAPNVVSMPGGQPHV